MTQFVCVAGGGGGVALRHCGRWSYSVTVMYKVLKQDHTCKIKIHATYYCFYCFSAGFAEFWSERDEAVRCRFSVELLLVCLCGVR